MFGIHWKGHEDKRNLLIRAIRMPLDDATTFWALMAVSGYSYLFYEVMCARYG